MRGRLLFLSIKMVYAAAAKVNTHAGLWKNFLLFCDRLDKKIYFIGIFTGNCLNAGRKTHTFFPYFTKMWNSSENAVFKLHFSGFYAKIDAVRMVLLQ